MDTLSLHLDDTFRPIDRLTVNLGARLEWIPNVEGSDRVAGWNFDDDFLTALPGAGLSYEITERWAVFGNYFHGFRAPQLWGFGSAAASGHGLTFEDSRAAEVGARARGPAGLGGAVTFWRNEYDDFGVFYDGSHNNLGEILAQGADFELDWNAGELCACLRGFSVLGALTLQDSELRSGPFSGNDVPYAWHEKASWRLRYARQGWTATLGGTYVGDSFSDEANTQFDNANGNLGRNPSRVIWDGRLAKLITLGKAADLELAVGANNLFDKDWHVHSPGGFFGPGLAHWREGNFCKSLQDNDRHGLGFLLLILGMRLATKSLNAPNPPLPPNAPRAAPKSGPPKRPRPSSTWEPTWSPRSNASRSCPWPDKPAGWNAPPKKIFPRHFVTASLLLITQPHISLTVLAVLLGLRSRQTLSKQGLDERLDPSAVSFLQAVLGAALGLTLRPLQALRQKFPWPFQRLLVQDSTTLKLNEKLAAIYSGGANQHGPTPGVLRWQAVFDLLRQRWLSFALSP
ncbi:MAG: TonB-dependent receptor [Chloroflexi bacterium]|nr:TonB-dependent receptor [Chloroflexota bacterium]